MIDRSAAIMPRTFAKHACVVLTLLAGSSACGSNPSGPSSSPVTAPTLASPQDDAAVAARPVLAVNNVAGGAGTARTYDFQVAETELGLTGPAEGLFDSATGIPEGNQRTSFEIQRDLQAGKRYFWRARVVQSGTAGAWSSTFRFRTEATANTPPVIQSITVAPRAEAGDEIQVTAVVQDQETNPAYLVYEWTATSGTFAGAGASVLWTAPVVTAPAALDLRLTVIERYTIPVPGGGEENHENRVTGGATVHVHDSSREITTLATTFIDDFLHSDRTPEFCVRNFSDNCPGKRDELSDIRNDRQLFINDPARSSMDAGTITFYDSNSGSRREVPPAQATFADFRAVCRFAATSKTTGAFGIVTGTCQLLEVYENWQWRQCDSHFVNPASSTAAFLRFPF
jgi:hypothetical protein